MRILFISNDLIAGNIAHLLIGEGHDVKLYIHEKGRRNNLINMVEQTTNWKKELAWVGKDGLIVFDDVGYGKVQDNLRRKGYTVFGGSEKGELLELNRQYGQAVFAHYGLATKPLFNLDSVSDAIGFIKRNPKPWVVKQNGHASKTINYIGRYPDGRDVVSLLENYESTNKYRESVITLQERIDGVEIGVGRYFNGKDWVGPIEINIEHKKMFPGDLGPTTSEMGTLGWYDDSEDNKLFQDVLNKLTPYLKEADFRGDMEVNCIVNEEGAFPLEATPRFGSPIIHLHSEIHNSPWGELLLAIARGEKYDLRWKKGYGIVIVLALPPFPYAKKIQGVSSEGILINFEDKVLSQMEHVHFEEVSLNDDKNYYISDDRGYALYVTGVGHTIEDVQQKVYDLIKGINIPNMFYRNDIGTRFLTRDLEILRSWGYIK